MSSFGRSLNALNDGKGREAVDLGAGGWTIGLWGRRRKARQNLALLVMTDP
jgi:hypothetical protein